MQITPAVAAKTFTEMRVTMVGGATRIVHPVSGIYSLDKVFQKTWSSTGSETDQYKLIGHAGNDEFLVVNDHDIGIDGCGASSCSGRQTSYPGTPFGLFTFKKTGGDNWGDYGTCCNAGGSSNSQFKARVAQVPVKLEILQVC